MEKLVHVEAPDAENALALIEKLPGGLHAISQSLLRVTERPHASNRQAQQAD